MSVGRIETGREYAALIGEVVASREHGDQGELLARLAESLEWANARVAAVQPLTVTLGDEFQGVYETLAGALRATALLSLKHTGALDLRFGVGWGEITVLDDERAPLAQSGLGWWKAREAIERVSAIGSSSNWPRSARTLVLAAEDDRTRAINAFLLCRDHLLARMDAKDARIALGLFAGERQVDLARELGIPQSAVSRRQSDNGPASVFRAHELFDGGAA